MAALLDLHPDTADAVSTGVADLHAVIDRLHATPVGSSRPSADVAEVDRAIRRLESYKLKLVAAADSAGVAKDAGFTGADAWLAKTTTVSRATQPGRSRSRPSWTPGTTPPPRPWTPASSPQNTRP